MSARQTARTTSGQAKRPWGDLGVPARAKEQPWQTPTDDPQPPERQAPQRPHQPDSQSPSAHPHPKCCTLLRQAAHCCKKQPPNAAPRSTTQQNTAPTPRKFPDKTAPPLSGSPDPRQQSYPSAEGHSLGGFRPASMGLARRFLEELTTSRDIPMVCGIRYNE